MLMNSTSHATLQTNQDVLAQAWENVRTKLQALHGDAVFRSWLKPLRFFSADDHKIQVCVPTRFMREWISTHYSNDIQRFWQEEPASEGYALDIIIHSSPIEAPIQEVVTYGNFSAEHRPENDIHMGAPLDPRYTFENFVVGKPNELAHAAARRVAEAEQVVAGCNPLFLYGGVGLGKTHLMHAIAWHIRRTNPKRRVMYLSAEKFMYQFIKALRFKESFAFKEQFRSVDVLMIDDVQFISGKDATQEEFFHTFNALVDMNKQLIISGDRSPSDMDGIEERVRSRLGWGLVADIHSTTYELRMGILQSKIDQMPDIQIPAKVIEFLAHKITSNVRELEGALNRVVAHATLVGRPVTIETTQEVLQDLLRAHDRRLTIEDIQKHVAAHFNIKISDMHSARRSRVVARPRQVAMYLAKKMTSKSLPEIGRRFGGKDHTTVMHAVKRVEELMAADGEFRQDLELLTKTLQN
jgi:chromosomal replication initiator protein